MARTSPRRRAHRAAVAAAFLAVLAVTACGPVDPEALRPTVFVDPPSITTAAQHAYGDRAAEAFDQAATLLLEQSLVLPLVDPAQPPATAKQLSEGIVEVMTPGAAQAWAALVERDLAGDEDARDAVRLLRFHAWEAPGSRLASPEEPVSHQSVTDGEVDLGTAAGAGAPAPLVVALVHRAGVTLAQDRVPYEVVLTKPLTLTLTPDPGRADRWLLASFEGTLSLEVDGAATTSE